MMTITELEERLEKNNAELSATKSKIAALQNQLSQMKSNIKHKFSIGETVFMLLKERKKLKVFSCDTGWLEVLRPEMYAGIVSRLIFNQNAVTHTPLYEIQFESGSLTAYEKEMFVSSSEAAESLRSEMQDELGQAKMFVSRLEEVCNEEIAILNYYESRYDDDV